MRFSIAVDLGDPELFKFKDICFEFDREAEDWRDPAEITAALALQAKAK